MHALILAPLLLGAPAMEHKEFENPGIVEVRAPGGDLTGPRAPRDGAPSRARRVEQVYAYEVRRGTAFPRELRNGDVGTHAAHHLRRPREHAGDPLSQ